MNIIKSINPATLEENGEVMATPFKEIPNLIKRSKNAQKI